MRGSGRRAWSGGRRTKLIGVGVIVAGAFGPCWAQQATTLNGAPVQLQPYVPEPGVPQVTVPLGTLTPADGQDGADGSGSGSDTGTGTGVSSTGSSSTALSTMMGTPWGAQAVAAADALGVNPSAVAATCVMESGCNASVGSNGSATGVFQMQPAAFQEGIQTALNANPALASEIVQGSAGMNDPVTEAIAASGYLLQANQALENSGITNPTVLDARAFYNFGPSNGIQLAQASPAQTMAEAMPNVSQATLSANGISPGETVAQWQASVSSRIGGAAVQSVLS
jgi:Transglycosylase SLT domain